MPENNVKKLYKDKKNGKLFGVCAGIAEYFGVDVTLVRIGFVAFTVAYGVGLVVYLAAAIMLPEKP